MNILIASAELSPFVKAGGLADVAAALPAQWHKYGQDPIVVIPKYGGIDFESYGFSPTSLVLYVPIDGWTEFARLWEGKLPGTETPVYLVENNDYFGRTGIYGDPNEYPDNDRRFIFFSRSVFEAAKALGFSPDIVHAHDFHTAFAMAFLKSQYRFDYRFSNAAGVFTIHNLAYQGWFDARRAMTYSGFGMDQFYPESWFEFHGAVNAMKTGIMFADKITTVSPTYSREIRTPYYSEGLQDVLNRRAGDLIGILNGVHYDEWNPETDDLIYEKYSLDNLHLKRNNKIAFLRDFGLTEDDDFDKPLVGVVSRLAEQKGIDLLQYNIEQRIAEGAFRFMLLGSGERRYEDFFNYLAAKYPQKALIYIGYNNTLSHRLIAASDYLLVPSRYEPCGLTQMYALKYGCVPIARQTGGLADTVAEYHSKSASGNGFTFINYNADDMAFAIRRALGIYQSEPHWNIIRKNGMSENFSSSRSALEYLKVFKWALEKSRGY